MAQVYHTLPDQVWQLGQKALQQPIFSRLQRFPQGDLIVDFPVVYCYDFKDLVAFCRFAESSAQRPFHTDLHAG
jgi:hypothetical protein